MSHVESRDYRAGARLLTGYVGKVRYGLRSTEYEKIHLHFPGQPRVPHVEALEIPGWAPWQLTVLFGCQPGATLSANR